MSPSQPGSFLLLTLPPMNLTTTPIHHTILSYDLTLLHLYLLLLFARHLMSSLEQFMVSNVFISKLADKLGLRNTGGRPPNNTTLPTVSYSHPPRPEGCVGCLNHSHYLITLHYPLSLILTHLVLRAVLDASITPTTISSALSLLTISPKVFANKMT